MKRLINYKQSFFWVSIVLMLGCAKHDFEPSADFNSNDILSTSNFATGKYGSDVNLPELKYFFIIDNSHTMSNSNIKIKQAFSNLYTYPQFKDIQKFKTEVFIIGTAQNINPDVNNKTNQDLIKFSLENNIDKVNSLTLSDLISTRAQENSGIIEGDLLGYGFKTQKNSLTILPDNIRILPAPVLSIKSDGAGGKKISDRISKNVSESISDLNKEFEEKLHILDPVNTVDDLKYLDLPVSNESGLCAVSRILSHAESYFKPSDIVSFILVSDEDDFFSKGKNCIDEIKYKSVSKELVSGQCKVDKTQIQYSLKATNVKFDAKVGNQCKVYKDNQFNFKFKYKPVQYKVGYYVTMDIIRDGIHETIIDKTKKTKSLSLDLNGKCNKETLRSYLPPETVFDNPSFPVDCNLVALAETPTETDRLSDSIFGKKLSFADSLFSKFGITKNDIGAIGVKCSDKINALLKDSDPLLKSGMRALDTCMISTYYYNNGSTYIKTDTVVDAVACTNLTTTCNSAADSKCHSDYTAATTDGYLAKSLSISEPNITCSTDCKNTNYCKSFPGVTVADYISTNVVKTSIKNCQISAGTSSVVKLAEYVGAFNCESSCKDNEYCGKSPDLTVKDYLLSQILLTNPKAEIATCSPIASSIYEGFGPSELSSNYCVRGTPIVDSASKTTEYVAEAGYVSGKDKDGVVIDLKDYIVSKSNSYFVDNKPDYSFFIIENQAEALVGQSVGSQYKALASRLGAKTANILKESYVDDMADFSEQLRKRLKNSIYFSAVQKNQKVINVWLNGKKLNSNGDWSASGGKISISEKIKLSLGDSIQIEYL